MFCKTVGDLGAIGCTLLTHCGGSWITPSRSAKLVIGLHCMKMFGIIFPEHSSVIAELERTLKKAESNAITEMHTYLQSMPFYYLSNLFSNAVNNICNGLVVFVIRINYEKIVSHVI